MESISRNRRPLLRADALRLGVRLSHPGLPLRPGRLRSGTGREPRHTDGVPARDRVRRSTMFHWEAFRARRIAPAMRYLRTGSELRSFRSNDIRNTPCNAAPIMPRRPDRSDRDVLLQMAGVPGRDHPSLLASSADASAGTSPAVSATCCGAWSASSRSSTSLTMA